VIETKIVDGELIFGGTGFSPCPVCNAEEAIERLLSGETIMLQQWGELVTQVQRTVESILKGQS
jgi:hypothetical protein